MPIIHRIVLRYLSLWIVLITTPAFAENQCSPPDQTIKNSIVLIEAGTSIGSGIVIAPNRILTAAHVVNEINNIEIIGQNSNISATVISRQIKNDLALIETSELPIEPVPFATQKLNKHDNVWAMGYPMGQALIAASGRYKGFWANSVYTSASVNFGQSGGGLITCERGRHVLAGMVRAFGADRVNGKLIRRDDISVATGIDDIRAFLATHQLALSEAIE